MYNDFFIFIYTIEKYIMNFQCVKVSELRKIGYVSLEDWMNDDNNVYVGRKGRIFITEEIVDDETNEKKKERRYFGYEGSVYQNPFNLKKYSLRRSLRKYRRHLIRKIRSKEISISELQGKTIGCFCKMSHNSDELDCHTKIIYEVYKKYESRDFRIK